ncbi:DUF2946 family protein [Geminicoccus flavidas]|uniref:DUF2946 family protein n=1 Tax=Geminicoccus flavidas TaxID=2506407 RepID=UPI0013572710|nr:DUF2946 family protein [Geminicoccus flavidas]
MALVLHQRLQLLAARLVGVALLLQVLLPPGLAPPQPMLAGADGRFLPTVLCAVAAGGTDEAPWQERDWHGHDHCVLCRLPGQASLGLGPEPQAALPLRADSGQRVGPPPAGPSASPAVALGFAARAPPTVLIA